MQIGLRRAGRQVLSAIDWRIRPGQRWVVVGANGAGKTQLLKIVAGLVWPEPRAGSRLRYRWHGETFDSPQGVQQEIAWLGPERQDRYERNGWHHRVEALVGTGLHRTDIPLDPLTRKDRRHVLRLLGRLGIEELAARSFLTLSFGERRMVLFARALAAHPRLLLLDEPFDGLDARRRTQLLRWLERSGRASLPWALATHRLDEVPRSATHLLVLERGRVHYRGRLRRGLLERWLSADRPAEPERNLRRNAANASGATARRAVPLASFVRASVWLDGRPVLQGLDFAIRSGECWIVHGGNGTGKTTLLRTLYGDHGVAHGGSIVRRGVVPGVPLVHFQRRTGLVAPHLHPDHPRAQGVLETVVSGLRASIGLDVPPAARERLRARRALAFFGLCALASRPLAQLSYGQMRRVLFARAWVNAPRLLLLDEPFAGVDPVTRRALRAGIEALVGRGVTVVMATHDREDWPRCATHEILLARGRVRWCGPLRAADGRDRDLSGPPASRPRVSALRRLPAPRPPIPLRAARGRC